MRIKDKPDLRLTRHILAKINSQSSQLMFVLRQSRTTLAIGSGGLGPTF